MTRGAERVAGCVLAGGRSRRMGGGDKAFRMLGGAPMLARTIDRLRPQTQRLILSANGDPARFARFALPVVPDRRRDDDRDDFRGPLAGVAAAMGWTLKRARECAHVVTAAVDTPLFPQDLVARFLAATPPDAGTVVVATSGGRRHPAFALWPVSLHDDLVAWLKRTETFRVMAFVRRHTLREVDFPPVRTVGGPVDPFFNVNEPDDLAHAERLLASMAACKEGRQ